MSSIVTLDSIYAIRCAFFLSIFLGHAVHSFLLFFTFFGGGSLTLKIEHNSLSSPGCSFIGPRVLPSARLRRAPSTLFLFICFCQTIYTFLFMQCGFHLEQDGPQ